ncbi:hypothetical protein, partial [Komagataeibacter sp. FXV3]|uniref:hypothetical protein n=1 Tax=Komagataeibacter sp. FXV3 TaxID=2608998 RepID=UPI001D109BD0
TLSILLSKIPPEQHRRPVKGLLRILAHPVNAALKTHETHGNQPLKPKTVHQTNRKTCLNMKNI